MDREKISQLTFYAVEIRYSEDFIELSIEEAKKLYEIAKEVKEFVMEILKEKGIV